jgi:hypothetical protein
MQFLSGARKWQLHSPVSVNALHTLTLGVLYSSQWAERFSAEGQTAETEKLIQYQPPAISEDELNKHAELQI